MKEKHIKVLKVSPMERPSLCTLENELSSLQKAVSIGANYVGLIEIIDLEEEACLLCNEKGKLIGLAPNRCLLISAEYVLGNYSTINRAVLLHIREAFDSKTLTYLQENRGLYGRFLMYFISYVCVYQKAVKKRVEDFYNRDIFHIPNVDAPEEYAGFQRVFRHYEILRLTAYAIVGSLPGSKQCEELTGMFKEATDICVRDTLEAVRKNAVTDFVKSFMRIFERDIVAEDPEEYRFDKQFIFFIHKEYLYFRGKDLTDYFLAVYSQTVSAKTISKELGKAGLLVVYGNSYSEKLPKKLDKRVGGRFFRCGGQRGAYAGARSTHLQRHITTKIHI